MTDGGFGVRTNRIQYHENSFKKKNGEYWQMFLLKIVKSRKMRSEKG